MSCVVFTDRQSKLADVTIRPIDDVSAITVEPKDAAVSLRQQLVRRGIACSFPMPTWERAQFEFHAKRPAGMSHAQLEELINSLME